MPKESVLQFNNYTVEELFFKNIPVSTEQHEFELPSQFHQEVIDLGENMYDVKLSFGISPEENRTTPFELRVIIVGHFTYRNLGEGCAENIKKQILHKNTVSILFPFLRAIVASLTSNANIPSLILPIMNFSGETKKN